MTIEDRSTMEVSDIHALRFECKKCEVSITYPARKLFRMPVECPACQEHWTDTNETDYGSIQSLAQAIRYLAGPGGTTAYRFRLDVRPGKDATRE